MKSDTMILLVFFRPLGAGDVEIFKKLGETMRTCLPKEPIDWIR